MLLAGDEDLQTTVGSMSEECVVQTWYRVLHTIGNPVDLCHSNVISQTPQFLQFAITNDNPSEHPCLSILPLNFYKAIKGVASLVDAFLGTFCCHSSRYHIACQSIILIFYRECYSLFSGTPVLIQWEDYSSCQQSSFAGSNPPLNTSTAGDLCSPTPPSRRRLAKSFSVTSSKSKSYGPL